jgi:hypothetical protein
VTPSSRAVGPRIERPARWKPTTNSLRQRLPGLSWPLNHYRLAAARRGRDRAFFPATRGPSRLQLSHRSHARDGPRASRPLVPQPSALAQTAEAIAARIPRPRHRVGPPRQTPRILSTRSVGATDRPPFRVAKVNRVSLPHTSCSASTCPRSASPTCNSRRSRRNFKRSQPSRACTASPKDRDLLASYHLAAFFSRPALGAVGLWNGMSRRGFGLPRTGSVRDKTELRQGDSGLSGPSY